MVSLVPDYSNSSLESSEDSENENNSSLCLKKPNRLPPPTFSDKVKNSVFVNPYLEAENAQIAVLEKHVKMTELPTKNSAKVNKICWMFKKGKCNYGKKCRFSHANVTLDTKIKDVEEEEPNLSKDDVIETEDSDEEKKKKRKKRPGLTRGLIPSKKVLKLYKKHKKEDEEEKMRYLAVIKSGSESVTTT